MILPALASSSDLPVGIEPHYTPEQTGARLSLSVPTIRRLERDGQLRGIRLCGRLRFSESAICEYLMRCANAPRRIPPPALLAAGGRPRRRRR